jgi:hypothetical protein
MKRSLTRIGLAAAVSIAGTIFGPVTLNNTAAAAISEDFLNGSWSIFSKDNNVSVKWSLNSEVATSLTVNGLEAIADDGQGHYYVEGIDSGSIIDFVLTSRQDLTLEKATSIAESIGESTTHVMETFETVDVSRIPFKVPNSSSTSVFANAAASPPNWSLFRYQTFISAEYVEAPQFWACTAWFDNTRYYFKGDNRGFDPASPKVRTRMDVMVDWANGGTASTSTFVGLTHRYRDESGVKVLEDSARATSDNMSTTVLATTSNSIKFKMTHFARNPFCSETLVLSIFYEVDVSLWRAGRYQVSGTIRRVPSHETYILDAGASWHSVYKYGHNGFECLNGFASLWPGCYSSPMVDSER